MLGALRAITRWGVDESTPPRRARRIVIMNSISLLLAAVTYPYAAIFYLLSARTLGLLVIPIASAYLVFPFVAKLGYPGVARFSILTLFNAAIFLYSASLGEASGIHLLYFAVVCFPLVISGLEERAIIAYGIALPMVAWTVLEVTGFEVVEPIALGADVQRIIYLVLVPTTFVILLGAILYFYVFNERHEAELGRALSSLWSEMDLAQKIQTVLLPVAPALPGYEIGARMVTASDVGGDYYDVIPDDRGGGWVLVGDVSGHGASAGLVMMMVQTAVRTALGTLPPEARTPANLLTTVNAALGDNLRRIGNHKYMTITAAHLCDGKLRFAGLHQDILVWRRATGAVERIETEGIWLGVCDDIRDLLGEHEVSLGEGDVALLFTDGVTEALGRDGRWTTEGLARAFEEQARRGDACDAIVARLFEQLGDRARDDDQTLLVLRRAPAVPA
jgi:serine phosphatase RsbU (regulator of sigma subunit)